MKSIIVLILFSYSANSLSPENNNDPKNSGAPAQSIWSKVNHDNFTQISNGIWNEWQKSNPENVQHDRFAMHASYDKLWLISKRLHRKNGDDPWDPASRGGIVSTLDLQHLNWSHVPYGRLDVDGHGEKMFSLHGVLYMITYSNSQHKINYSKIFYWNDGTGQWHEIAWHVDPSATTASTNDIVELGVSVSYADVEEEVYFAAVVHGRGTGSSEIALSKLYVEYEGQYPVNATLYGIAQVKEAHPYSVVYNARVKSGLVELLKEYGSEGYHNSDLVHVIYDKSLTNQTNVNFSMSGSKPTFDWEEDRIAQLNEAVYVFGGHQHRGVGGPADYAKEIWNFDPKKFAWRITNATLPDNAKAGSTVAFYPGFLFVGGLKEGVWVLDFPWV